MLVGDLAIRKEQAHLIDNVADDLPEDAELEEENSDEGNKAPQKKDLKHLVVDITEANIHEFTINDVVMPMVGHDVRLPSNKELEAIIVDIMTADGIKMEHFTNQSQV